MNQRQLLNKICYFRTKRLLIKSWRYNVTNASTKYDLARSVLNILTPEVSKSLPTSWHGINNINKAIDWLTKRIAESAFFTVELLTNKEIIGFMILHQVNASTPEHFALNLGYLLSKITWGKGFGTEMISGLLKWCEASGMVSSISAGVNIDNKASIKILENNGFSQTSSINLSDKVVFWERKFF